MVFFSSSFYGVELKATPKQLLATCFCSRPAPQRFIAIAAAGRRYTPMNCLNAEKASIKQAFKEAFLEVGYKHPKKVYGTVIEDRGTQVTFSALGQDVVDMLGKNKGVAMKEQWLLDNRSR